MKTPTQQGRPMKTPTYAVFVVAPCDGGFAATTRPSDPTRIGLPGGKVRPGETALRAVIREAWEEGWELTNVSPHPIWSLVKNGRLILWFRAGSAEPLTRFKEDHRLQTVIVTRDQILGSGFGNETLKDLL